jgi:hypothetical protein
MTLACFNFEVAQDSTAIDLVSAEHKLTGYKQDIAFLTIIHLGPVLHIPWAKPVTGMQQRQTYPCLGRHSRPRLV